MAPAFTVGFQITARAMSDAARLYQANLTKRLRILMVLIAIGGAAIAMSGDVSLRVTVIVVPLLMLASTVIPVDRWLYGFRGRGLIGGRTEISLDEQGIHYEHPLGSGVVAWRALTGMRMDARSILFVRDRVLAAYVPTSAFGSLSEHNAFLAYARERVGQSVATPVPTTP